VDPEQVLKAPDIEKPNDISRDNRFLLFEDFSPSTNRDLFFIMLQPGGKPQPYRATPAQEADGRFSPDGRWLAYCSDENRPGDFEIFVSSFRPRAASGRCLQKADTGPCGAMIAGNSISYPVQI
jgi:Tol biopolymer transport system component